GGAGAGDSCGAHSIRIAAFLRKRLSDVKGKFATETAREALRKSSDAARSDAKCKNTFEIAAAAIARASSACADPENLYDRGRRHAARGAERIICPLRARPGKIGGDDCAARKVSGGREFGLRGIDG